MQRERVVLQGPGGILTPAEYEAFVEHCRVKWREVLNLRDKALLDELQSWLATVRPAFEARARQRHDFLPPPPSRPGDDPGFTD